MSSGNPIQVCNTVSRKRPYAIIKTGAKKALKTFAHFHDAVNAADHRAFEDLTYVIVHDSSGMIAAYRIPNLFQVQKRQWSKWSVLQRAHFNETFLSFHKGCCLPPKAVISDEVWSVIRWNCAFMAACAISELPGGV